MELIKILDDFQGTPLNLDTLSSYERWALTFFHNEEEVLDPNVDLTLQLDTTSAEKQYHQKYHDPKKSSLTAYLYWCLIQAMKKHACFSWRIIDKKWYQFKNLPLTFPILVDSRARFNDILIRNVFSMDCDEFCMNYRAAINKAITRKKEWIPTPYDIWRLSIFIGNQPNLQFTALSPHIQKKKTGMPLIYLGRRYKSGHKLLIPFFIHFDHSNLDPYVIDLFLKDFQRIASS